METPRTAPSPADLATEANGLLVGLGILTMTVLPFALPGLALALLVAVPLVPLAVVAGAILLLARIARVPLRLARGLARREPRHRRADRATPARPLLSLRREEQS